MQPIPIIKLTVDDLKEPAWEVWTPDSVSVTYKESPTEYHLRLYYVCIYPIKTG